MSSIRTWLQAARPLAQFNIALPLLVGQLLAFAVTGAWSWPLFALTQLAGVVDQLFVVFANDIADEEGDRQNTTFNAFSGGSRVLPDGKLQPRQLARAAIVAAIVLLGLSTATAAAFARPLLLPAWLGAIGLLLAYSYAPLRLSYRGHGELVQGVGLGVLLPLIGFYAQAGTLASFPWPALAPLFLVGFAGNINTGLPDRPADAACGKHTWAVRFGDARARKHSLQFLALAVFATPWIVPTDDRWIWAAIEAGPVLALLFNLRSFRTADPDQHAACRRFVFVNGLALNLLLAGWCLALASMP
jgi:1,4-dihydroxy-2-naphthoate octaprenyltransferase